jgi:hypothetical protein
MGVPPFEEGVSYEVAEGLRLHGFVLFESVEVDLLLHAAAEGLDVGAQAGKAHDDVVLHLEDSLEIVGEGQHLLAEPPVSSDPHAVLAHHAHDRSSVVLKNAHSLKIIQISHIMSAVPTWNYIVTDGRRKGKGQPH